MATDPYAQFGPPITASTTANTTAPTAAATSSVSPTPSADPYAQFGPPVASPAEEKSQDKATDDEQAEAAAADPESTSAVASGQLLNEKLPNLTAPIRGAGKALTEHMIDVDNSIRHGLNLVGANYADLKKPVGDKGQTLKRQGIGEGVGDFAENVLEFVAGDSMLKSLSIAERMTKLASLGKALEEHPMLAQLAAHGLTALRKAEPVGNAARVGLLAAGQTRLEGGTWGETAAAGIGGVAGEGIAAGAGAIHDAFIKAAGKGTLEGGGALAADIAGGAVSPQNVIVKETKAAIQKAKDAMHTRYDTEIKAARDLAKDFQIGVADSPMAKQAKKLLNDENIPQALREPLRSIAPESERAEPFLKTMAEGGEEKVIPQQTINKGFGTSIIPEQRIPPKLESMTLEQWDATRQRLGRQIRTLPEGPMRNELISMRTAMDDTLAKAATDAGKPEIAEAVGAAKENYAVTQKQLEANAIQKLAEHDPNTVASVLMNKESIHDVGELRKLIGQKNMKMVEGGMFQQLVDQSLDADNNFVGKKLANQWKNVSKEVKQAIWGDRVKDIDEFVKAANHSIIEKVGRIGTGIMVMAGVGTLATGHIGPGMAEIVLATPWGGLVHAKPAILRNENLLKATTLALNQLAKPTSRQLVAKTLSYLSSYIIQNYGFPDVYVTRQ